MTFIDSIKILLFISKVCGYVLLDTYLELMVEIVLGSSVECSTQHPSYSYREITLTAIFEVRC